MKAQLLQTKKDFLSQESTVNMHEETMEWLSELEFCKTELMFLSKLLDKAFLRTTVKSKISQLSVIDVKVKTFREKTYKDLHDSIIAHELHLAAQDERMFSADAYAVRVEHKRKQLSIKAFMGAVKKLKKEVFDFVEVQLKQVKKISNDFEDGSLSL